MDERQQQRVNQAAEEFADAIKESYRAGSERGVSAQELNAELTENFFNQVINNLQTQASDNREMTQQLVEHKVRAEEAKQTLTQESVGAYMEFMNSMFNFAQGASQEAKREA